MCDPVMGDNGKFVSINFISLFHRLIAFIYSHVLVYSDICLFHQLIAFIYSHVLVYSDQSRLIAFIYSHVLVYSDQSALSFYSNK